MLNKKNVDELHYVIANVCQMFYYFHFEFSIHNSTLNIEWCGACFANHYQNLIMGFDQYHEPPEELSEETRTLARMLVSLTEEAEAINWYEQRISVEKDAQAKAILENAQQEEFKHFGMDLEFLLRKKEKWRTVLKEILFKDGDIVKLGEKGEEKAD